MDIKKRIAINLSNEEDLLKRCGDELRHLKKGCLSMSVINGKPYYYHCVNGNRYFAGNAGAPLVSEITERKVLERAGKILRNNISLQRDFLRSYKPYDIVTLKHHLPKSYQNIPDICYRTLESIDTSDWDERNTVSNDFHEENLIHRSASGIPMRSRVEVSIADLYTFKNIKFLYEEPLQLNSGRIIYPDFTVYVPSERKTMYHEHCGMMNDPGYRQDFETKISDYVESGLLPYRDVIFTFDDDGKSIDLEEISRMIDTFMT